jgi:hypothetical protein
MPGKDPDDKLGPKPDPKIEPGEPNPGGADAIDGGDGVDGETAKPDPYPRDLDPDRSPAVEDALPDELTASEDTDTEANKNGGREVDPGEESPA